MGGSGPLATVTHIIVVSVCHSAMSPMLLWSVYMSLTTVTHVLVISACISALAPKVVLLVYMLLITVTNIIVVSIIIITSMEQVGKSSVV